MENLLKELIAEVRELNKRIGANGYNSFLKTETNLVTAMEEMSIKLKRLNQTISSSPISLDKHINLNKQYGKNI